MGKHVADGQEVARQDIGMNDQSVDTASLQQQEIVEEVRISVRELVEFLLRSGDIDNRHHASPDQAMQEGGGYTG